MQTRACRAAGSRRLQSGVEAEAGRLADALRSCVSWPPSSYIIDRTLRATQERSTARRANTSSSGQQQESIALSGALADRYLGFRRTGSPTTPRPPNVCPERLLLLLFERFVRARWVRDCLNALRLKNYCISCRCFQNVMDKCFLSNCAINQFKHCCSLKIYIYIYMGQ